MLQKSCRERHFSSRYKGRRILSKKHFLPSSARKSKASKLEQPSTTSPLLLSYTTSTISTHHADFHARRIRPPGSQQYCRSSTRQWRLWLNLHFISILEGQCRRLRRLHRHYLFQARDVSPSHHEHVLLTQHGSVEEHWHDCVYVLQRRHCLGLGHGMCVYRQRYLESILTICSHSQVTDVVTETNTKSYPTTIYITSDVITTITKPHEQTTTSCETLTSTKSVPVGGVSYSWSTYTTSKRVPVKTTTYKTELVPYTTEIVQTITTYSAIVSTSAAVST